MQTPPPRAATCRRRTPKRSPPSRPARPSRQSEKYTQSRSVPLGVSAHGASVPLGVSAHGASVALGVGAHGASVPKARSAVGICWASSESLVRGLVGCGRRGDRDEVKGWAPTEYPLTPCQERRLEGAATKREEETRSPRRVAPEPRPPSILRPSCQKIHRAEDATKRRKRKTEVPRGTHQAYLPPPTVPSRSSQTFQPFPPQSKIQEVAVRGGGVSST